MKIAVFCNSFVAFPAIDWLIERAAVAGLIVPLQFGDVAFRISTVADRARVPFLMGTRKNLEPWLRELSPQAAFVMTYPFRIPQSVLDITPHGFFNFHPGLLPQYRGPDPIFWEIRNQEPFGAVTVHRMDARFDTGPIVHQERVEIDPQDTYGLHLEELEAPFRRAASQLLQQLEHAPGEIKSYAQDERLAVYHPKPQAGDFAIQWTRQQSSSIAALTRACHPWHGGATTRFREMTIHFGRVTVDAALPPSDAEPGTILSADPHEGIHVACLDGGSLRILSAGTPGNVLTGGQFAQIFNVTPGERFFTR